MAILITGGAGYIGSHTCLELLEDGFETVVIDDLSNSSEKALDRISEITGKPIKFYKADVKNESVLDKIFSENNIDAVIHFAGFKAVGESVEKPLLYYENNLESTVSLLKVMGNHGCRKIVFSSSATVYGLNKQMPLKEGMPTGALNPYGRTKLFIEEIMRDLFVSDNGWGIALLRYFNPIGAHKSGLIGEDPKGIPNNLMPYIAQVAVGRRERLNVFGNDYATKDGTGVRDYIHVVDLAKGHVKAVKWVLDNNGCEEINLGTGKGTSVLELREAFERVNGVKIPFVIAPRRAGDADEVYADVKKAEKLLGWKAELGIDDMCKDTWNWQKNNPNGYN